MRVAQYFRRTLISLMLVLVLAVTTGCSGVAAHDRVALNPGVNSTTSYAQIERGNTATGQTFGSWVVQVAGGLLQDAYVRDNDKLGVVITPQVRPNEVRPLAKSLVQGFQKNFPNRDLKVLVYAPDKKLILTANYNNKNRNIEYQ